MLRRGGKLTNAICGINPELQFDAKFQKGSLHFKRNAESADRTLWSIADAKSQTDFTNLKLKTNGLF